ncbi:MAG TPA: hypothetical protein VL197_02095 [Nitrospirota bacterium]|nr:hypothetical protein [Nitrospirota bacterium]
MNVRKVWRKAIREQRQRERADDAVKGAIFCFLGLVVLALLAGCGGSGESSGEPVSTWSVATNNENGVERSRAWQLCGGTISCSYMRETPPDKSSAGGFIGSATASQAACYQQYSGSNNLMEATEQCP